MGVFRSLHGKHDRRGTKGAASALDETPTEGSAAATPPATVFFSPHQDDELLTLGVYARKKMREGEDVYVVLCVDGSRSGVRKVLHNGKECRKCAGPHEYDLSVGEFVAARDREFASSCAALGYAPSHVLYHPDRAEDLALSVEQAERIIGSTLALFPSDRKINVCTLSPFVGEKQHHDHRNLGEAAVNLYRRGGFDNLELLVEPYCVEAFREQNPGIDLHEIPAEADDRQCIEDAIAAYSLWDPANGRYAVGYHSVTTSFDDFRAHPSSYMHAFEDSE